MTEILTAFEVTLLETYDELPKDIKKKFKKQLKLLQANPKHPSLKIHKIQGTAEFWEFYIDDFYRCVFTKTENIYRLRCVGPHKLIDMF